MEKLDQHIKNLRQLLSAKGFPNDYQVNESAFGRLEQMLHDVVKEMDFSNTRTADTTFRISGSVDFRGGKDDFTHCDFLAKYDQDRGFQIYKTEIERYYRLNLMVKIDIPIDDNTQIMSRRQAKKMSQIPNLNEQLTLRRRINNLLHDL